MNQDDSPGPEEVLKLRIKNQIQDISWAALEDYHQSDELLLVASNLDLIEVGYLCSTDDLEAISEMTKNRSLTRIDDKLRKSFESKTEMTFELLNMAPFIFIKRNES